VQRDLKDKDAEVVSSGSGPKSLDELEKIFETSSLDSLSTAQTETKATKKASKSAVSPFGGSSAKSPASPFGSSSSRAGKPASPFGSAAPADSGKISRSSQDPFSVGGVDDPMSNITPDPVEDEPWWGFVKQLKTAQIVTVISFTLIILLMLATFKVVLGSGAIHFND